MPPSAPAIEAHNLTIQIEGHTLLDRVSMRLEQGQTAILLGPNGCGKTTLARTLMGFLPPRSGQLHVLGQPIGATDVHELRQRVRIVSSTGLLSGATGSLSGLNPRMHPIPTILTGIDGTLMLHGQPDREDQHRAAQLLRVVGLSHREHTPIGSLSTGEQRRLLLARAMITPPQLLILDEAAAGLDVAGREQMLLTLRMLTQAQPRPAVLMITHHVEEMPPNTDRVFLMRETRMVAEGPPDDVITPEYLTQTFGCRVFVRKASGRYLLEVLPEAWLDLLPDHERSRF
ncbi:ABC transporter ATP-binding protein [Mucisphaera sp.]|uniref:ABC transporter ATP-binding protein n=1 Tax=Mucisphaera sp. TaxID=2913024 RepID=UPI003D0B3107